MIPFSDHDILGLKQLPDRLEEIVDIAESQNWKYVPLELKVQDARILFWLMRSLEIVRVRQGADNCRMLSEKDQHDFDEYVQRENGYKIGCCLYDENFIDQKISDDNKHLVRFYDSKVIAIRLSENEEDEK